MDRFEHSELAQDLFARMIDLEELFTHLQRTVQDLDEVVRKQNRRLDALEQALARLAGQVDGVAGAMQQQIEPADERPPHY